MIPLEKWKTQLVPLLQNIELARLTNLKNIDCSIMDDATIRAISGVVQTIVGHPLDTLKVWKQSKSMRQISIQSLYSGITYPTLNHMCIGYFLFGSSDYFYKIIQNYYVSGWLSGIVISFPVPFLNISK